ncbi:MAG: class I SAM-dependent methyltransferase [Actinobacteria bacterium]|nr:class I SAM-dependent methyltransferase [Actinomycetota bacterium]
MSGPGRAVASAVAPGSLPWSPLARTRMLARAWSFNWRVGWPERQRGLHYWLGFEYALLLTVLDARAGGRWLDVGTGAHSIWPYLLAHHCASDVVAVDLDPAFAAQSDRRDRVARAHDLEATQVGLVRADARRLPFDTAQFDGFTAVSALEHVAGVHGDRQALAECARVLRPGGVGLVTVPFRAEGSVQELTDDLGLFQWHYSPDTLTNSFIAPSGLTEQRRLLYAERLPFHAWTRRWPAWLDWARRPWDTIVSGLLLRPVADQRAADAVLLVLRKPDGPVDATGRTPGGAPLSVNGAVCSPSPDELGVQLLRRGVAAVGERPQRRDDRWRHPVPQCTDHQIVAGRRRRRERDRQGAEYLVGDGVTSGDRRHVTSPVRSACAAAIMGHGASVLDRAGM